MTELTFIYRLTGMSYDTLAAMSFRIGVVDDDDAKLTRDAMSELNAQGKSLWGYVATAEAESYREYWKAGGWDHAPPGFVVSQNPDWPASHRVAFWDEDWQLKVLARVETLVRDGYSGAYFDVVDVFNVPEIQEAYAEAHPEGDIKQAAEDFVVRISEHAKALNPEFKIIVQNAVTLLSEHTIELPTDPLTPNQRMLDAIDGIGKESTFTLGETYPLTWTKWDARYIENATEAGKFVIGIEYPLGHDAEQYALTQMLKAGYIPHLDERMTGAELPINDLIPDLVDPDEVNKAAGHPERGTPLIDTHDKDVLTGNRFPDIIRAHDGDDRIRGMEGNDIVHAGRGDDFILGGPGDDTLRGGHGSDTFLYDLGDGRDTIVDFNSGIDHIALFGFEGANFVTLIMPSITYMEGNALITLGDGQTLLLLDIEPGSLSAVDFVFAA